MNLLFLYLLDIWACTGLDVSVRSAPTESTAIIYNWVMFLSAKPEVRGTADTDGGAYSPFQSILLVLTHDFIIIQILRTDGQWRTWMVKRRGRWLHTIFVAVWGEGSAVCFGPRPGSQRSPYTNYFRLGWWSTDRPRPMDIVRGRGKVQLRSGILAYLCTRHH